MALLDTRRLDHHRDPELEQLMWKDGRADGNIAGEIWLGGKSTRKGIRFTLHQTHPDGHPVISLSGENNTRCTDDDVRRFMGYAQFRVLRELQFQLLPFVRTFKLLPPE